MGRYAPDQETEESIDVECPECKHIFGVGLKLGVNVPDIEVFVVELKL